MMSFSCMSYACKHDDDSTAIFPGSSDDVLPLDGGGSSANGPIFRSAARLHAEDPDLLRRRTTAYAAGVHAFALAIAVGCTVMLALVVVTFDGETTKQWMLATVISLFTSWFSEPLKVSCCRFCHFL